MNIISPISATGTSTLYLNKSLRGRNIVFRVNVNGKPKDFPYAIADINKGILFVSIQPLPLGVYSYSVYDVSSKQNISTGKIEIRDYETGSFKANEDSVTWDDLRSPATGINPGGSPSPATPNNTDGSLTFGTGNVCIAWFQFPHNYKEGTGARIHIHWSKSSSAGGTVNWQMKYKWANIGDVMPGFSVLASGTDSVPDSNTADKHALTEWTEVDGTGKTISSMLCVFLRRTAAGDSYGADANLYEIDAHYVVDSHGSREEYVK